SASAGMSTSGTNDPPYGPKWPLESGRAIAYSSCISTLPLAIDSRSSRFERCHEAVDLREILLAGSLLERARNVDGIGPQHLDGLADVVRIQPPCEKRFVFMHYRSGNTPIECSTRSA